MTDRTDRRKSDTNGDDYMPVRELNTHFSGIHDSIKAVATLVENGRGQNRLKLEEIHEQTKTTNSRVTKLESWRDRMLGGIAVLVILAVPLLIFVLRTWLAGYFGG